MAVMSADKIRLFVRYTETETSLVDAARKAGVSESWARKFQRGQRSYAGRSGAHPGDQRALIAHAIIRAEGLNRPLRPDEMCPEALRALDDFGFFRERYMGRVNDPWHTIAATAVENALKDPDKTFIVLNCPPGVGKSAFLRDLGVWLTVKNRRLRAVGGSRTFPNARKMTGAIRRTLERGRPTQASTDDIAAGLAIDATGVLAADYGLFRPIVQTDVWRQDEFVVMQDDDTPMDEKEYTWSAVGMETSFLGNRFDLILWDDVVDKTTVRTMDAVEAQREWWDDVAETRLEPGGLLVLCGQRFDAVDLYRYCLDKRIPYDEDDLDAMTIEEVDALEAESEPMYQHIRFQAHDESICTKNHSRDAPAQPEGCLLAPRRLPWRELRKIKAQKSRTYAIQYQQEDADPEDVLVPAVWVSGGHDPITGQFHPGCWDNDRIIGQIPQGIVGPCYSTVTVDPSPTKWWAIQWWLYYPQANQLFLIDLLRTKMDGDGLLDWHNATQSWSGVMLEWQKRSIEAGAPISHWIVEANVAQRWLLRFEHARRFQAMYRTKVREHQTGVRKLDQDLGVSAVKQWWEYGQIRLPGGNEVSRLTSLKLVSEVTRYPNAGTDDQVMANWFEVYHLPQIVRPARKVHKSPRPGFVSTLPSARSLRSTG